MCNCVLDWIPDDEVDGDHKMIPYTCQDYTRDLEKMIESLLKTQADGLKVLGELAKIRSRRQLSELAWRGDDAASARLEADKSS